jgi:T4 RnlA family RNA ligase
MSFDPKTLPDLIQDGYIISQTHPTLPLTIYNYSAKTQYEKAWNPATLNCRGLVLDDQYQTIARPLTKFFNLTEYPGNLPNGTPEIYEKLDGSMILLFFYADRWRIASRGSFASEQADKARELLHNYQDDLANLDRTYTYMLEVIYPHNRIVVDYGAAERLVMLAGIHTATGVETPLAEIPWSDRATTYPATDLPTWLKAIDPTQYPNHEGFILKWPNGFRVKYKLEEYVRLHRVLTRIQAKDIWECMSHDQPLDEYLEMVPDEFYQWVKKVQKDLLAEYAAIETTAQSLFKPLADFGGDRKAAAAYISGQSHCKILFLMLDDRDYSEVIWRQIKPGFQLPFRNEA